ncbi:RICIN domain-containing protein [Streptomyces sp. SPB074]|uniref:RICIN domain-containing protein n=1 Tax=Streptomyces sp. (strain SPB074) TaxID=465543 RepID=UPI0001D1DB47|nr:RICIN domain-containing protein [Streptomyces sp. SPB074]EFG65740.1 translation initiation factor IF-2 [Streptomyces sp. SPB074]
MRPLRPSHRTPDPADPAEQTFTAAFRRSPARAPHGLVPSRRVWVTLGWAAAVSATVTLSAVAARGTVLDDEGKESPALAASDRAARVPAGAAPSPSAPPTASPSPSPAKEAAAPREESRAQAPAQAPAPGPVVGAPAAGTSGAGATGDGAPKTVPEDTKPVEKAVPAGDTKDKKPAGPAANTPKKAQPPAQDFSRPLGAIVGRYEGFQGHCVQLAGGALKLYPCDGGADQKWQFAKDGTLRKNGRCLSLVGRSTNDGTHVVMAACDTTNVTQWRYSPGNDIVNVAADKCLDVANASLTPGTPLQIAICSGNAAQKWNVP